MEIYIYIILPIINIFEKGISIKNLKYIFISIKINFLIFILYNNI